MSDILSKLKNISKEDFAEEVINLSEGLDKLQKGMDKFFEMYPEIKAQIDDSKKEFDNLTKEEQDRIRRQTLADASELLMNRFQQSKGDPGANA